MTTAVTDSDTLTANVEGAPSVAFYTLGCKTNQLETATLASQFGLEGWQVVPFDSPANVYVINTCTVTERSDRESQRIIRRAHLSNPNARIVATGCYAQVAPQEVAALPGVTHVVGNNFKDELVAIASQLPVDERPLVKVSEIDKSRVIAGASSGALDNAGNDRTRGSLKIQDGCDYKCTYCIIWEARGKSRSLPVGDLTAHLAHMVADGFKEIVLTGINIGQYQDGNTDLAGLLEALVAVPGQFRLRLTSLDPLEVTDALIATLARHATSAGGKLCNHVHLSAQSAQDDVLKQMARRHHVADMVRVCEQLAAHVPHISIGSDIIVGFPGETDQHFLHTEAVLSAVPMNYLHVFSYSKRKGTPAASYVNQVPEREKKARANRLRALADEKSVAFRRQFVGKTLPVIVEEDLEKGMSDNYIRVTFRPGAIQLSANMLVAVEISEVLADETIGTVVEVLLP